MEIRYPAPINRSALNIAWVMRWKNPRSGRESEIALIITPSWLRVDRAMIFFISHSNMADIPAINIVEVAISRRIILELGIVSMEG